MEQFIPDGKGNEDMVEKSSKDFPAIDQDEIMKRTSVGNALKCQWTSKGSFLLIAMSRC